MPNRSILLRSETNLASRRSNRLDDSDYDTHYQMGIAYQEMGLLEEAISEYQDAIALVGPNDGTRRFFQCANLLGHCFCRTVWPIWHLRGISELLRQRTSMRTRNRASGTRSHDAYEAEGDVENAGRYFEQVYAENVDYRDVGERIRRLAVQAA